VLLVTHDLEAAATADRSCTLRDGKLTEGHPDEGAPQVSASRPHTVTVQE
jgi:ABC-type lipoprotein export system ATPase subunit